MGTFIDRTGQRLKKAVVLSLQGKRGKEFVWKCRCDCGNTFFSQSSNIASGRTKSCGCLKSELIKLKKSKDFTGKKFGLITVIERYSDKGSIWNCVCECGKKLKIHSGKFKRQLSCGCLRKKHVSSFERGKQWRENNKSKVGLSIKKHLNGKCKSSSVLFDRIPSSDNPIIIDKTVYVSCKNCGKLFSPRVIDIRTRISCLDGVQSGESNFYCSDKCKEHCAVFNAKTNHPDPRLRKPKTETAKARSCQSKTLKQIQCDETNGQSYCEKCGDLIDVELHHTIPVAELPKDAINPASHILLCAGCHVTLHRECR